MLVAKKDLDYYPDQMEIEENKPKKRNKKNNRRKKNSKVTSKLIVIGIAVVGLFLSLFILYRYVNLTKIQSDIIELEQQRIKLTKEKDALIAELEAIKSSSKIEEDAKVKLGMGKPTEEQIVYIDIEESILNNNSEPVEEFKFVNQLKNIINAAFGLL